MKKSYRDLDIYHLASQLAIDVHSMTMELPKYELFEQGSQIRRSSKSIVNNIVEGYGRKRYKQDFIRFLIYAHSSCDECIAQLNMLDKTHNGLARNLKLVEKYEKLGRKLYRFIEYVEKNWQ